jgi:hypothetical protein
MCNDYANRVAFAEYQAAMRDAGMQIVSPLGPPNLEPRDDIWPSFPASTPRTCPPFCRGSAHSG